MKIFSKKIDAIIVVDISSCLKLANIELKAEPRITALKIIELKAGKKDELVVNAIRDFIKEHHLQHKNALLSPSLKSLLIKRIELPDLPDAELPEAIKWKVKEGSNLDLAKYAVEYQAIGRVLRADATKAVNIICAVAEIEEVRLQALLLKQAGLNCLSASILPFGYAKIIAKYFNQPDDIPQAVLHLDDDSCYIGFYKNNRLDFYRKIPASINKLKESLSVPLVTQKGRLQLGPEEIGEILTMSGIPIEGLPYEAKMAATQILSLIRAGLERLAQEIKLSLAYYDSEFQAGNVKSIFIAGPAVKIPNLDKFLSKELLSEVSFIPVEDKIKSVSGIDRRLLKENAGVFGLAFNFETGVNLLPYEFRTQKLEAFEKLSLRWVAFIAFLLLAVSYVFAKVGVGALQKRLDSAAFELNVLSEITQIKQKIGEFEVFSSEIKNSEFRFTQALKKISNIAPAQMFFSRLNINRDSSSGVISGYLKAEGAEAENFLTKFARELEGSLYFKEVNISSMKKDVTEGNIRLIFELNFKLR